MMTPQDTAFIQKWGAGPDNPTLTLATAPGEMGDQMGLFCDQLKALVPALKIKKERDETLFSPPAMIMGRHGNIAYQALPTGKILGLFLSSLTMAAEDPPDPGRTLELTIDDALHAQLQQIDLPVSLKLYMASQCPHCPGTLKQLLPLAAASRHLRLTIIDAQRFELKAQQDQIQSVPTLILDGQFRWSGPIDVGEVLTLCIRRDPTQLSAASLRQLIDDGQAQRVAQMMADADAPFPALMELLTHERWSVRLGAMVTTEYLADETPHLALGLAALLWERFTDLSDPVKGDVLHLFGQVNCDLTRGYLNSVRTGPFDATVKEAAAEVLEEME
jgi:glutaredoxin